MNWIFQGARPHSAQWEEIAKSGTERLCAPKFSNILQSFNVVGHVIRGKIEIEDFKRRAPQHPLEDREIADWATLRTNVWYHSAKLQLSRPRNKEEIVDNCWSENNCWRMNVPTHNPFDKVILERLPENLICCNRADFCILSSYQVSNL